MRAVDTNILARFYLRDDAAQGRMAASVLSAGDVFVPKTVILELEWVLRYVADQPEDKVIECLEHLIALPGITVEDRDEIEAALSHCRKESTLPMRYILPPVSMQRVAYVRRPGLRASSKDASPEATGPSANPVTLSVHPTRAADSLIRRSRYFAPTTAVPCLRPRRLLLAYLRTFRLTRYLSLTGHERAFGVAAQFARKLPSAPRHSAPK